MTRSARTDTPWIAVVVCIAAPLALTGSIALGAFDDAPGERFAGVPGVEFMNYLAYSREANEGGNGLFYGDPFSVSDETPRILTHLPWVLLGAAHTWTGVPLGTLWLVAQFVAGILMFHGLWRLVACFFPPPQRTYAFVLLALGGGGAAVSVLFGAEVGQVGWLEAFRRATDTGGASWFTNVYQNGITTNQVFYHALAFYGMAEVLSARYLRGFALLALLWWAHPLTGIEVGLIIGAHVLLEGILARDAARLRFALGFAAFSGVLTAYYLFVVPGVSPEAADVNLRFRQAPYALRDLADVFPMWGVFLAAPLALLHPQLRLRGPDADPTNRLLVIWIVIVALLVFHDRLMPAGVPPFQPLHFAHGWLFLPLAILLLRGLVALSSDWPRTVRRPAAAALLAVALVDNVLFTWKWATSGPPFRPSLDARYVPLLDHLAEVEPGLVAILVNDFQLTGALLAETPHRSWLYYYYQTPYFEWKERKLREAFATASPAQALAELGIGWVIAPVDWAALMRSDLDAGRARVVLGRPAVRLIEIQVPLATPPLHPPAEELGPHARPPDRAD